MYERFTKLARKIIFIAQEEARSRSVRDIAPEHLLYAAILEDSVAARLLSHMSVNLGRLGEDIKQGMERGEHVWNIKEMQFSKSSKDLIRNAYDAARQLNNNYIGSEHLMLGAIRVGSGHMAGVLTQHGVTYELVLQYVVAMQEGKLSNPVPRQDDPRIWPPPPRVPPPDTT
jgi:ATP-dependent Clp protease ATP-binding subunit ClpC